MSNENFNWLEVGQRGWCSMIGSTITWQNLPLRNAFAIEENMSSSELPATAGAPRLCGLPLHIGLTFRICSVIQKAPRLCASLPNPQISYLIKLGLRSISLTGEAHQPSSIAPPTPTRTIWTNASNSWWGFLSSTLGGGYVVLGLDGGVCNKSLFGGHYIIYYLRWTSLPLPKTCLSSPLLMFSPSSRKDIHMQVKLQAFKCLRVLPGGRQKLIVERLANDCARMHQNLHHCASSPLFFQRNPSRLAFPMLLPDS